MKYAAFLRGINVGGKTIVRMEELRKVLSAVGLKEVKTYIQSGNVVFESDLTDESELIELIENAVETNFFRTPVMIRSIAEIVDAVANNPFANEEFSEKLFHIVFLYSPLDKDKAALLLKKNSATETFAIRGRDIYCFLREGVADSALGKNFIGGKLKTPATARNWRTVKKILEL